MVYWLITIAINSIATLNVLIRSLFIHTTRKRHPNNNALLLMAISTGTVEYKRQSKAHWRWILRHLCKLHVFWVSYLHVIPNVSASVNISRPHPAQRLYIRPKTFFSVKSVIFQTYESILIHVHVKAYMHMKQ